MTSIFLHSAQSDFADTQRVPELAYLGRRLRRSSLQLCRCGCERPALVRIARSFWMRAIPFFRHYLCRSCGDRILRLKTGQHGVYCAAVYLPARPV